MEFSRQEHWNGLPFPSPGHQVLNKYQIILYMSYCLIQAIRILHYHFHFADEHLVLTEKAMTPHSSTLAWRIPWTEEPGGLQSMGLLRVEHD